MFRYNCFVMAPIAFSAIGRAVHGGYNRQKIILDGMEGPSFCPPIIKSKKVGKFYGKKV